MAMVEIIEQLVAPDLRHQAEQTSVEFKQEGLKLMALGLPRAVEAFYTSLNDAKLVEAPKVANVVLGLFLLVSREDDPIKQDELRLTLRHLVLMLTQDSEVEGVPELYDLNQWLNL